MIFYGSGSETYSYNSIGALNSRAKTISSTTYTTSYGYDSLGGLTSITYPSGRVVAQTYDAVGRLSQISSGGTNYLSSPTYNAAGQTLRFNYGNGIAAAFTYNDHLQLASLRYTNGSSDILKLNYGYGSGNNGQIQTIDDVTSGSANAATSLTYAYDAWSRLKTAQTNDLTSSNTWKLEWGYDRLGNRLSQTQSGGMATNIVQPNLTVSETTNRITTSGYTYDLAGNMTNDSIHAYTYDAENRIKSLDGSGTYVYDGNGLRTQKGTTTYIYSGTKVIAEYTSSGLQREYVYSGSGLLATLDSSGTPTYAHADHLSTRLETNSSGSTIRTYGHYPFGDSWYETGTAGKLLFTSYERDNDSFLDYAIHRYDSSRLGVFTSIDPAPGDLSNPQTLGRYSYVHNDPVNLTDPLGLCPAVGIPGRCGGVIMHPPDSSGSYVDGAYITGMNASLFHSLDLGAGYLPCPWNVCSVNVGGQQANYAGDVHGRGGYFGSGFGPSVYDKPFMYNAGALFTYSQSCINSSYSGGTLCGAPVLVGISPLLFNVKITPPQAMERWTDYYARPGVWSATGISPDDQPSTLGGINGGVNIGPFPVGVGLQLNGFHGVGLSCFSAGPYIGTPGLSGGAYNSGTLGSTKEVMQGWSLNANATAVIGGQITSNNSGTLWGPSFGAKGVSASFTYGFCW